MPDGRIAGTGAGMSGSGSALVVWGVKLAVRSARRASTRNCQEFHFEQGDCGPTCAINIMIRLFYCVAKLKSGHVFVKPRCHIGAINTNARNISGFQSCVNERAA